MDTNELTTPENILTDCLNGTLITYNGKEFTLQNDFGNGIVESAKLKPGFIPIGIKEYGGIIYVVSHNPMTLESEFGSFPSPERNITPEEKGVPLESSGVGTIEMSSSDFISNGDISLISVRRDLMKSSDFSLNPGDRYAIFFTDAGNYNTLMQFLTAGDTRKYYKLKVAKVSESGIVPIEDFNIYNKTDIVFDTGNVNYDVYRENTIGTLAIVMQLETIDNFDFTIKEKIISSDPNNKIAVINATATCRSLVKFKGVRLIINEVSTGIIVYDKYLYLNKSDDNYNTAKMSFELAGFSPEIEYSFKAIPFSQFNMYDKIEFLPFTRIKNFIFGKQYSTGLDKYNFSLFKYFVEGDSLKVNFNYNVNTAGNIIATYAEFYDPWSNASTLYHIEDFVSGADSLLSISLESRPATQVLSDTDVCGIPLSDLVSFANYHGGDSLKQLFVPTLTTNSNVTQGDKLIRTSSYLRKNHFYIVKISAIEETFNESSVRILQYNDIYRCIYTNGVLNYNYTDSGINNMSNVSYPSISVKYSKGNNIVSESESTLSAVRSGAHTLLNNVYYPYSIKSQSSVNPGDIKTFKTEITSQKDVSISSKYILDKTVLNTVFGVPNYNSISVGSTVNGSSSVIETPSFIGNQTLSGNLNTGSNISISNISTFVNSDYDIDLSASIKASTKRAFYGSSVYNLSNVKTLNTFYWTSLYDQLHNTAKDEKILVEFGIRREYHNTGSSNRYHIGIKTDGYTPEQTTQRIYNDNRDRDAIATNPNSTATKFGLRGPDGDLIRSFVLENTTDNAGFVGKFVGNSYYALDTNLGANVARNEYVLMLRRIKDSYSEFAICPAPFLPETGTYFFQNLFGTIKDICGNIVNVSKGNVSYMKFAPTINDICYNGLFQTSFKTSGYKIPITVSAGSASKVVFLSSGSTTLVDYTSNLIKNYVDSKGSAAEGMSTSTVIFYCPEKSSSIYSTGISTTIVPLFSSSSIDLDIDINDISILPVVDQFEKNLYEQASVYILEDPDLKEKTTFPETGKPISEGIMSKNVEYEKYASLFEMKDNIFNYKGNFSEGYTSDGTDDRKYRNMPDLLIDFAK